MHKHDISMLASGSKHSNFFAGSPFHCTRKSGKEGLLIFLVEVSVLLSHSHSFYFRKCHPTGVMAAVK
jgi:hypothetical protein